MWQGRTQAMEQGLIRPLVPHIVFPSPRLPGLLFSYSLGSPSFHPSCVFACLFTGSFVGLFVCLFFLSLFVCVFLSAMIWLKEVNVLFFSEVCLCVFFGLL